MIGDSAQWFCFRVSEEVARGLTGQSPEDLAAALGRVLKTSSLKVEPLRPGVDHPAFRRWFRAPLKAEEHGPALLQRLLDSGLIEYGYVKSGRPLLMRGWTV